MNSSLSNIPWAHLLMIVFLLKCTPTAPEQHSGNTSETGNPSGMIVGTLYEPDGITPASGVQVAVRPRNTISELPGYLTKQVVDTATVYTNEKGLFVIDTLDDELYIIEADNGKGYLALIDSIRINKGDSTVNVVDTLRPGGSISGIVHLPEGGDPQKAFVLVKGIDRFTQPDSTGKFSIPNLAEAEYDLTLIAILDEYDVLDIVSVRVSPGTRTDLDTLTLRFTGIPSVQGLSIAYDTLSTRLTLTWATPDTTLFFQYHVYRRTNSGPIQYYAATVEPILIDSGIAYNTTYYYAVRCVDQYGNVGELAPGVEVSTGSPFRYFEDRFYEGGYQGELIECSDISWGEKLLIADHLRQKVMRISGKMDFLHEWGDSGSIDTAPFRIAGYGGGVLQVGKLNSQVRSVDSLGEVLWEINMEGTTVFDVAGMNNKAYILYYDSLHQRSGIEVRDTEGEHITSWELEQPWPSPGLVVEGGRVYCAAIGKAGHEPCVVDEYDSLGRHLETTVIETDGECPVEIADIAVDRFGRLYILNRTEASISVYNSEGAYIATFGREFFTDPLALAVSWNHLYVAEPTRISRFRLPD